MGFVAKWLFLLSLCVWIGTWFLSDQLPTSDKINPELYADPMQTPTSAPPFYITYRGENITVQPVAEYTLRGVVVSHNDPKKWYRFDITHDDRSIDTRDLCVVWGDNVKSNDYTKTTFYSGDYTCGWEWRSGERGISHTQLSNNHLITNQDSIREAIAKVSIGDQIIIRGKLVHYTEQRLGGIKRPTSTTRTDSGNGACEVVFVEDLKILSSHNTSINQLHTWSYYGLITGFALLFVALFFFP